jgi:osmotically-inducible protein OsmY
MKKNNEDLQRDVLEAIKWEPLLIEAEIGVIAKDGVITLTGIVDSYAKKVEAEDAAKSVLGVQAVVEKIEIKFEGFSKKNDTEIANEIVNAFKWNWSIPDDKVKVIVEDGWVTLEGELEWNSQKKAAEKAVSNLIGVKFVTNNITIKSDVYDKINQRDIERALERNNSINHRHMRVTVSGNRVTLYGTADSWYDKDEAARIAWNAPGVWKVENDLNVEENN